MSKQQSLENQEDKEYISGELIYYAYEFSKTFTEFFVLPLSDFQFGDPMFSEKHLDRAIDFIASHGNCATFLGGDLCDSVIKSSVGNIYKQIKTPQDQRDWVIDKLTPIKAKILGCITGNHEDRIARETGIDISEDIAKQLGVPYRPEGMMIKISFGSFYDNRETRQYPYWGYFTHGYGGARTEGARIAKAQRVSTYIGVDFVFMGHDHKAAAIPDMSLEPDPRTHIDKNGRTVGKVIAKPKMIIKGNAYTKFGGHGEMHGFSPVNLVPPVIRLMGHQKDSLRTNPRYKEIRVEVSSG